MIKRLTYFISLLILPSITLAQFQHSLSFDGSDDYVTIPANSVYTVNNQSLTIQTWINTSTSNSLGSIIQGWYGFGFQLYILANGTLRFV